MPARVATLGSPTETPLNFERQRKRARALLKSVRAREPEAIRRIATSHPDFTKRAPARAVEMLSLHDAQLVIAREYGFATWAQLKAHIHAHTAITPLGNTALIAAANRALETDLQQPLYRDPFARELAGEDGWAGVRNARSMIWPGTFVGPEPYLSITTRYFDDALQRVVHDSSIRQIVILGAGMDARAYRCTWPAHVVLFEVDLGEIFDRKEAVLRRLQARARCERRLVKADLARAWGSALRQAGFDPRRRTAFLAEGVLLYLDEPTVRHVFGSLKNLAASDSWIGFDVTSADTLASAMMKPMFDKLRQLGRPSWRFGMNDPEAFAAAYGWHATSTVFGSPAANYGRWPYAYFPRGTPGIPRAFFVEGRMRESEGRWQQSR